MSIFGSMQPSPKLARNAFDLSQRHVFSSKFGVIKPVACIDTMPNGHYEIDVKQLLRSQPLQTAAFTGFKVTYDVLYTPYNYLMHSFNQFIAGRGHTISPVITEVTNLPYFKPYAVYYMLYYGVYLERCVRSYMEQSNIGQVIRNDEILTRNFCILSFACAPGNSCFASALRNLDMLGYGNALPLVPEPLSLGQDAGNFEVYLRKCMNNVMPDVVRDFSPSETLLDWFGSILVDNDPSLNDPDGVFNYDDTPSSNFFRVLAYNKFFVDHYRSKYYTDRLRFKLCGSAYGVFGLNYTDFSFSLDGLSSLDLMSNGIPRTSVVFSDGTSRDMEFTSDFDLLRCLLYACLFCEKHHLYKRDLFSGVLPSTQFGDVSVVSSTDTLQKIINPAFAADNQGALNPVVGANNGSLSVQNSVIGSPGDDLWKLSPATAFSILDLRKSEALQRYNERLLRAGDDIKSVFEAHGWNGPRSQSLEMSLMLGSFDGNFDLNVVASTTQGSDVDLGQLASNGVATVNGKKIYFDSQDFGVIMVVMHTTKNAEYNSVGVDPVTQLIDRFDFPFPEFQSITLQPVMSTAYNNLITDFRYPSGIVMGYLPTSYYYKTAVDKVHGLFYSLVRYGLTLNGAFSNWVVPRFDDEVFNESFFYCDLRSVDNIFTQQTDPYSYTDKFFVNCYLDIKCVLPLPVIGLPD